MTQTVEDYLVAFVNEKKGLLESQTVGESLRVKLLIAGRERLCAFGYAGNPIRACVQVGIAPEDIDQLTVLQELLGNMDHSEIFSHRVICGEGIVHWVFDILMPNCSLAELFGLWFALAEIEIAKLDEFLVLAEGGTDKEGRYHFPVPSTEAN